LERRERHFAYNAVRRKANRGIAAARGEARPSKRVPKPLLSGSETEGPPHSFQIRRTKPGRSGWGYQRMAIVPCGPLSAPYFTALVASS